MARKRRRNPQSVYLAWAAILGTVCLLYWVLISKGLTRGVPDPGTAPAAARGDPEPVRPASILTPRRAIYPYSVIRGGAYSVAELDAALLTDPVAAAHYAVFDRARLGITRAPASAVYVSYRQGDRVYWTRRKVRLAPQEPLLTDGVHAARARCGNRISLTPQDPVQAVEPSAIYLDWAEPPPTANLDASPVAPPDVFSAHMLVHEIFPALLPNWLPGTVPGGSPGSPAYGASAPGVIPLPECPEEPLLLGFRLPLLLGFTLPSPIPGVLPIDFATSPLPPVNPVFLWIHPEPLPGGRSTGIPSGQMPGRTALTLPAVWGLPPIAPVNLVPGVSPFPLTTCGLALSPITGISTPSQVLLPPNAPLPFAAQIPEPATAALLLCGAALLARRRFSRRRLH